MYRQMVAWTLVSFVVLGVAKVATASSPPQPTTSSQTVEMFQAMRDGQIEVKFIPKDAREASVLIKNKTDKPLTVKLPDAFAATPVLAQLDGGGLRPSGPGSSQALGGGMPNNMGPGMAPWNIPPEKIAQIKVPVVCLEHGKPEPRPAVPYVIKPLEEFSNTSGLREVLQALANGQVSQRVAQAAAWHLENGMSFQELASKQLRFANGVRCPYFSPAEIRAAMQLVAKAKQQAKQRQQSTPSPSLGETVGQN